MAVAKSGPAAVVAAAYISMIGLLWFLAFTPGNGSAALLRTVPALRTGTSP